MLAETTRCLPKLFYFQEQDKSCRATLWLQLSSQAVVGYGHITMSPGSMSRSELWYSQAWPVQTLICSLPWAFSWDPWDGDIQNDWKSSVEDSSAFGSPGEWLDRKELPFNLISPGLEWENKQETMTKIPMCLIYGILDLFAVWLSIDFWSKWCFMLILWSSLICE